MGQVQTYAIFLCLSLRTLLRPRHRPTRSGGPMRTAGQLVVLEVVLHLKQSRM